MHSYRSREEQQLPTYGQSPAQASTVPDNAMLGSPADERLRNGGGQLSAALRLLLATLAGPRDAIRLGAGVNIAASAMV